jgi:hypothetical protein
MGIVEVITALRSPWQNAYVERVIGSMRRECLDRLVIFNERHLRRVFISYLDYYHRTRTHLSLDKDCPEQRPIQAPKVGKIMAIPKSVVCTIATSALRRDSSHSPLMPPQRPVPHGPRISWSKPAHLIRLEAVTDFDRSCFRVPPAERFSLSRLLKSPFRNIGNRSSRSPEHMVRSV